MENIKNRSIAIFYLTLSIFLTIFLINYGFTDWEEVSSDFSKSINEFTEVVECEIKYKDFYYKGFCVEKDNVFSFLNTQYNNTKG